MPRGRIPKPSGTSFWAGAMVALVCAAVIALSVWREWGTRQATLEDAERDMANLARSVTQHAEDAIALLDASILGIVSQLSAGDLGSDMIASLTRTLQFERSQMPRIHGLFVYDETGHWRVTSEKTPPAGGSFSDRGYFRHHQESESQAPFLGSPIQSRKTGNRIITLSRRFNHSDGRFAGIVLASAAADFFTKFFEQFPIGSEGSITLVLHDGTVIARSPSDPRAAGDDPTVSPPIKDPSAWPDSGIYHTTSPQDGQQRMTFYKRSNVYPLIALTTMTQQEVLADWRRNATFRAALVLALTTLIACIGGLLVRQLAQGQRLVDALTAKEADFRLLAEESSDMVMRIGMDDRIRYSSPSSLAIVGRTPAQLLGMRALNGIHPEDRPAVDACLAALRRGDQSEARAIYRTRLPNAEHVWLESNIRMTRDPDTGVANGAVAVSRDVTLQVKAQRELATLANLDGLTGIANRRCFDERLAKECARSHRDGTPLSMLLIDVDHFKKYNDHYGHPAGDTCLQRIAHMLAAEARRPEDLPSRYGGEEFVLLLPNTDLAGCTRIGNRLLQAIRLLALPHENNVPAGPVSLSIGGATLRPGADDASHGASLLKAADRSLYIAKSRGRDQLIMADQADINRCA